MSPRQNRRRREDPPGPAPVAGPPSVQEWAGVEYAVRRVSGTGGSRTYRCPGCDQPVPPGTPHVVAWPAHDGGAEHRRHWHATCWAARDRRSPPLRRGRAAPRH